AATRGLSATWIAVTRAPGEAGSALASPVPHSSCSTCLPVRAGRRSRIAAGMPGCSVELSTRARWSWSQACRFSSVGSIKLSEERVSAVDDERLAAHHLRLGRAEEADGVGDVSRRDQAAGGRALRGSAQHLLAVREDVERVRLDDAAGDGVDADAARGQL